MANIGASPTIGSKIKKYTPEQIAYEKRIQDAVDAARAAQTPQTTTPIGGSNSMISGMYDAALQAKIAALEGARDQSLADATAAKAAIPQTYQAQANTVAANAGKEKQNFNEFAAASGLNSGAGGQAALALAGQLQSGLTQVRTNEANAMSDADLQIAKLRDQYQQMRLKEIADNQAQRTAALIDQTNTDTQRTIDQQRFDANLALEQSDAEYQRQLNNAKMLASVGDYSGFKALGWSDAQIAAAQTAATTPTYTGPGTPKDYTSVYQKMKEMGITSEAEAYAYLESIGKTGAEAEALTDYYLGLQSEQPTGGGNAFGTGYDSIYTSINYAVNNGASDANVAAMINKAVADGRLTYEGANAILTNMGLR